MPPARRPSLACAFLLYLCFIGSCVVVCGGVLQRSIVYSLYFLLLPRHVLSTLIFSALSPTHFALCPHHLHHLPFIVSSPSSPSTSSSFTNPPPTPPLHLFPLFSASVESLRLHGYSDRGLCRGGGLLFWHAARRYCTTCTCAITRSLS